MTHTDNRNRIKITVEPEGKTFDAAYGETVKTALNREGYYFIQACGGKGKCGFCRVEYMSNAPAMLAREVELLGPQSKYRLACMHKITEDTAITLPPIQEWLGDKTILDFKVEGGGTGFGIAGDLGTTTIALYLVNLTNGEIIGQVSFLNPQVPLGADIMTRLEMAKEDALRIRLNALITESLAEGIGNLLSSHGAQPHLVKQAMLAGNSAMTHIFLGWGGEGLERAPFKSPLEGRGCIPFNPETIGLDWECACELAPILSGFMGGDAAAAIIASNLDVKPGARLMIDLGTNGEIALSENGEVWGCSAAAGPAFEGEGMQAGMPALKGAIEGFDEQGIPIVIGGGKPLGICGSGYISGLAFLLSAGILQPSGLLNRNRRGDRIWKPEIPVGNPPVITQDDIRKFQLAKGAVSAGIEILCSEAGLDYRRLEEIIITGSFGNRIDSVAAVRAGLIPPLPVEKITFIDNAAGRGAALCLSSVEYKRRALNLQQKMKFVNLGEHPRFQDLFVEKMRFPEPL